jgi:7-cyano-7-deazaguanine synthase in queuosine biosynthesis
MSHPQAIVLLSGGIDSAACVHLLKAQGMPVEGIFFDYDKSRHRESKPRRKQSENISTLHSLWAGEA